MADLLSLPPCPEALSLCIQLNELPGKKRKRERTDSVLASQPAAETCSPCPARSKAWEGLRAGRALTAALRQGLCS